jgi:hypothetical protein
MQKKQAIGSERKAFNCRIRNNRHVKKRSPAMKKKIIACIAAGVAAYVLAKELPAMIRYYKMTRM